MIQNPDFNNALKLLAVSLNPENNPEKPDLTSWPAIKKELEDQAVISLVSDYAGSNIHGEEGKAVSGMVARTVVNVRSFHKLMMTQKTLIGLFDARGIRCAIMKGAAAAQYYPRPSLRQFGDIDVLVLPEDYDRAFYLLKEQGYKNMQELDSFGYKRHIGFNVPNGIEIELHRYFSSSNNEAENTKLDSWLYEALKSPVKVQVEGYEVPVFPDLENGLILLGHINQHLGSGLGLRQIIDWMMYVKNILDDRFWQQQFRERVQDIGMDHLAKTVTRMCQLYLGLTSDITWCSDADESLAEELMEYIHGKGNFGKKQSSGSRNTVVVLRYFSNPVKAFKYLTYAGTIHMKADGLKPCKAVAWLYQIGHLLRATLKRRDKVNLAGDFKKESAETDLLKRLKVTRI